MPCGIAPPKGQKKAVAQLENMAKARMTLLGKHTSDNSTTATLGDPLVNPVT
jgi:hypothetical protein